MKAKVILVVAMAVLGFAMVAPSAHALNLDPTKADWISNNTNNCNAACVSGVTGIAGLVEVYKQDVGGGEAGSLAGSYSTAFNGDLSSFTVTYNVGSAVLCGTCVLVVKDGNHQPAQYFFNLSFGTTDYWNGMETITGTGFWPNGGAISHIQILNVGGARVPEPASLLLLGAGLAGLGIWRRKQA